ncbi:hypothetical protein [Clostridium sp. Marseille-QA1073]
MNYSLIILIGEIFNIILYGSIVAICTSLIFIVLPFKILRALAEYICIMFLILWVLVSILCIVTLIFEVLPIK